MAGGRTPTHGGPSRGGGRLHVEEEDVVGEGSRNSPSNLTNHSRKYEHAHVTKDGRRNARYKVAS
jgi:hypothetical protein